jgi:hypothetical protein
MTLRPWRYVYAQAYGVHYAQNQIDLFAVIAYYKFSE